MSLPFFEKATKREEKERSRKKKDYLKQTKGPVHPI